MGARHLPELAAEQCPALPRVVPAGNDVAMHPIDLQEAQNMTPVAKLTDKYSHGQ
jgi:hypothetical protein